MAVKQWCFCVGLSPNKKSIFGLRTQIVFIVLTLCFVAGVSSYDSSISCSNVRSIFESKGILSAADVQDQPTSDAGELCLNRGCCTSSSRSKLMQHARSQLESSMRIELNKLADILSNRAKRFDEFFRKLLQQSREEFHAMFKRTYGMIYEQHSYVFEQLFQQLESYYTKGDTDLDSMMENFFGILYQKMFKVLNSQYNVDDKYLKCVSEHMRDTQPFDDVPHKLSVQLRRAFVATRTFHKALRHGAEIVRNMQQMPITQECVAAWSRLRYCGQCGHSSALPACSRYCHNVLRGCLPAHADLAPHWDAYVDAVEKVADRLLGPFNIVMVVEPIDIKISEAIMNFQEHNQEISQKIFAGCGKPSLGGAAPAAPFFNPDRSRRSIRSAPEFEWSNQRQADAGDFELEASFESLMKDPLLYRLGSRNELKETTKRLSHQAEDRQKFLQYLRGDVDAEEYEDHERRRREAEPEPALSTEIDYRAFEFGEKKDFGGKKGKKTVSKDVTKESAVHDWGTQALERLVREARSRVRNSRRYWANLPYLLCSEQSVAAAPAAHATCFNGTAMASYTLSAAGEGSAALASNPEVRGVVGGLNQVAAQQEALKQLTSKLKDAYNGVEIQWRDDDDLQYGSSSLEVTETGSGSGSGDDSDELPDDDEDNERDNYPASGQGPSPTDYDEPTPVETEQNPPSPPASEVPYTPYVVPGGDSDHNVHMTGPEEDLTPEETPEEPRPSIPVENPAVTVPEVKEAPAAASAQRPSLEKALFTYALPVVCAWFGGLVTDFF